MASTSNIKIQTQKSSKERLFIMTRTHKNLFVFGSCFTTLAVILFQIFVELQNTINTTTTKKLNKATNHTQILLTYLSG